MDDNQRQIRESVGIAHSLLGRKLSISELDRLAHRLATASFEVLEIKLRKERALDRLQQLGEGSNDD